MTFFYKAKTNVSDAIAFGPQFWRRHLPRLTGADMARVAIPGFGHLYVRPDESDVWVIRDIFQQKRLEIRTKQVADRINTRYRDILNAGKNPIIVDAGANIGASALWFLGIFPQAEVIAVEPEEGNLAVLRRAAEDYPRITVIAAAVGPSAGFVTIPKRHTGWGCRTVLAEFGIPMITMADAFKAKPSTPFIAKIDIEGFESDLFSGNTDWLNDIYVAYIEPHDWMLPGKMSSHTFQKALSAHNFEIFIVGEHLVFVRI
jgi:FkbM family methyltransferase